MTRTYEEFTAIANEYTYDEPGMRFRTRKDGLSVIIYAEWPVVATDPIEFQVRVGGIMIGKFLTFEDAHDASENYVAGFKPFRRKQIAELRPWTPDYDMKYVSVSSVDLQAGSPKEGDMIARNPKNWNDQWLVARQYFEDNFEEL